MSSHCLSAGLGITLILLVSTGTAFGGDACYCRTSTGEHVAVGGTACLKTNRGMQEARCGFVLNNTAWRFTGRPCPQARRDGDRKNREIAVILAR
jgi:hypothetical protein